MAASKQAKKKPNHLERIVTFEIVTPSPLPVGQQVFISGNIDMLGNWEPDGFPLNRQDDDTWYGYTVIEPDIPVEFKVTRGSWRTEECDESGAIRKENHKLPNSGNAAFKHRVIRWLDRT